jgi:hypothetical protein
MLYVIVQTQNDTYLHFGHPNHNPKFYSYTILYVIYMIKFLYVNRTVEHGIVRLV